MELVVVDGDKDIVVVMLLDETAVMVIRFWTIMTVPQSFKQTQCQVEEREEHLHFDAEEKDNGVVDGADTIVQYS